MNSWSAPDQTKAPYTVGPAVIHQEARRQEILLLAATTCAQRQALTQTLTSITYYEPKLDGALCMAHDTENHDGRKSLTCIGLCQLIASSRPTPLAPRTASQRQR